jgi:hypothetical protein
MARLRNGSRCVSADLRADLDVTRGCTVSGVITQRFGDVNINCGISAAVAPNHEVISGVGACDSDDILMFNIIRRSAATATELARLTGAAHTAGVREGGRFAPARGPPRPSWPARRAPCYVLAMDRAYWTKKLRGAEAELEAATTHTAAACEGGIEGARGRAGRKAEATRYPSQGGGGRRVTCSISGRRMPRPSRL